MTDPSYYGYSAPHSSSRPSQQPTGKQLLGASWGLLQQDRDLLWLPVLATLTGLLASMLVLVPFGWRAFASSGHPRGWAVFVVMAVAGALSSAAAIFFQTALVLGANQRADGGDPTLRGVLAEAWSLRRRIFAWAALSVTVGSVMRVLEERLGILGRVVGFLGGVAWAIASFFVVPVLVAEDLGPVAAAKRSAQLIADTWGTSVRTTLRFGVLQLLVMLPILLAFVIGVVAVLSGSTAGIVIGAGLLLLAVVALLAAGMASSAITAYARALIYRYATGQAVPGIDPTLFAGAFTIKKRRVVGSI